MQSSKKRWPAQLNEPTFYYYTFPQRPGEGHYILNKERGVTLSTIIQAPNIVNAIKKANHIGIFPEQIDGWTIKQCEFGCPFCAPRWSNSEITEHTTPTLGTSRVRSITSHLEYSVCIHLMDDTFGFIGKTFEETPYELAKLFYRLDQKHKILPQEEILKLGKIFRDKTKTREEKKSLFKGVMFPLPKEHATILEFQKKRKLHECEEFDKPLEELEPLRIERERTANDIEFNTTTSVETVFNTLTRPSQPPTPSPQALTAAELRGALTEATERRTIAQLQRHINNYGATHREQLRRTNQEYIEALHNQLRQLNEAAATPPPPQFDPAWTSLNDELTTLSNEVRTFINNTAATTPTSTENDAI